MKPRVIVWLATSICICPALSAYPHHAYGLFFDLCTSVTLEGRVDGVEWKTPHVWINLTTDEGTAYRAEWTSQQSLSNRGVTAETLKPGDRIAVTGSPMRDPASARDPVLARRTVSALTSVRRPSDAWTWTLQRNANSPDCGPR
jgi:hypothetical protein